MSNENPTYLRIDVGGENDRLWTVLRQKFIRLIEDMLDKEIDPVRHTTFKEEAERFTSALLDYGRSKLQKPGIDNEKKIAEIQELYSQRQKNIAETRKLHAETDAIELANKIRRLKLMLHTAKAIMTGTENNENLLFLKNMDGFLQALNAIETDDSSSM